MLTLERRRERSIYNLSAKEEGEGVHGLRPNTKQHTGVGRPVVTGRPEAREGPDVRCLSDVRRFGSGGLQSDVRTGSDVRSLEVVGRPVLAGRPEPVASSSSLLLLCLHVHLPLLLLLAP